MSEKTTTLRVLNTAEVLTHVLSLNDNSTIASAARVCRSWSDVALRQLWSHVIGLVPLINTLSPLGVSPTNGFYVCLFHYRRLLLVNLGPLQ